MRNVVELDKSRIISRGLYEFLRKQCATWLVKSGRLAKHRSESAIQKLVPWTIVRYDRVFSPDKEWMPYLSTPFVSPRVFREHLSYLKREANVIPLDTLVKAIDTGTKLPENAVVLTFDGGWLDHYEFVYPALREFGLPATFFLPTFYIGTSYRFWQDQVVLSLLLLRRHGKAMPEIKVLPEELKSKLSSLKKSDGVVSEEEIVALVAACSSMRLPARELVFKDLGEALEGIEWEEPDRTFMTWEEVREMKKGGMSFGSYSHFCLPFSEVAPKEVAEDLHLSYATLIDQQIDPSRVFAFPWGIVSEGNVALLKQLGINYALAQGYMTLEKVESEATVLERISIDEKLAPTEHIFACRIARMRAFGFQF